MRTIDPKDAASLADFRAWVFARHDVIVAVDPGLQGTGLARFEAGTLTDARVMSVPSKMASASWTQRADYLADGLQSYTSGPGSVVVICEMPEFQGGATRSMGWKTGDLQRLAFLVGLFSARIHPHHFAPVGVAQWKGQLPKRVVEGRLTEKLGVRLCRQLNIQSHAWDAVGIGMWSLGRF